MKQRIRFIILHKGLVIFAIITVILLGTLSRGACYEVAEKNTSERINTITLPRENEQRIYPRFENSKLKKPVVLEKINPNVLGLINVSRGGLAVKTNNSLKVGDIIAVHLLYNDISILTEAKIVFTTDGIAGAEFIEICDETFNQLLYLSVKLEADNGMLVTKLSES